jgi:large subunit ribosomal protein L27
MAKTKSVGSTRLGRESRPKYLGTKLFGGESAKPGSIIIRQRGTRFVPGINVRRGSDDTLYAIKEGVVRFKTIRKRKFDKSSKETKVVDVI